MVVVGDNPATTIFYFPGLPHTNIKNAASYKHKENWIEELIIYNIKTSIKSFNNN